MAPKDQVVRLLMVEDSMETAEQLISALRNGGIPVRPARDETAAQLAAQIDEHTPDLILVDAANKSPTLVETVAAVRTNCTCLVCSLVSGPSSSSSRMRVMLWIEPSGVRNSWLMYERKRLFNSEASRSCRA